MTCLHNHDQILEFLRKIFLKGFQIYQNYLCALNYNKVKVKPWHGNEGKFALKVQGNATFTCWKYKKSLSWEGGHPPPPAWAPRALFFILKSWQVWCWLALNPSPRHPPPPPTPLFVMTKGLGTFVFAFFLFCFLLVMQEKYVYFLVLNQLSLLEFLYFYVMQGFGFSFDNTKSSNNAVNMSIIKRFNHHNTRVLAASEAK